MTALLAAIVIALMAHTGGIDDRLAHANDPLGSVSQMRRFAAVRNTVPNAPELPRGVPRADGDGDSRTVLRIPFLAADGVAEPYAPELTPEPPPVKEDAPVASPEPADAPEGFWGEVTHYGESFNGLAMGCSGSGVYRSWDTTIAAVPWPSRDNEWPCGTRFVVSGPTGSIHVVRTDSCPGCHSNQLDLSEAGMLAVCGYLGRCPVWIEVNP